MFTKNWYHLRLIFVLRRNFFTGSVNFNNQSSITTTISNSPIIMTSQKISSVNNSNNNNNSVNSSQGDSAAPLLRPIVIWGPSGAGKSTLLKRCIQEHKDQIAFAVSHTTRKPRTGEIDGQDYYFVEKKIMEKAIESGEFVEHVEFSGNLYGTSKKAMEQVQNCGKICVLDLELKGVLNVKKLNLKPLYIAIKPPSLEILEQRLRNRGTESDESIAKRLQRAKEDLSIKGLETMFDLVIINDDIDDAFAALNNVIETILQSKSLPESCICSDIMMMDKSTDQDIPISKKTNKTRRVSCSATCRHCYGINLLKNEFAVELNEAIMCDADESIEMEKSKEVKKPLQNWPNLTFPTEKTKKDKKIK